MHRMLVSILLTILLLVSVFALAFAQSTPTSLSTVQSTPLPQVLTAKVLQGANLRAGPSTTYARVGSRPAGAIVTISGVNAAGDWYQLDTGQWLAAFLVQPVVATPTPTTVVTGVVPLGIGSWNVESGGADPQVVGERLATFADIDLWGLSEVLNTNAAETLEAAAEQGEQANFESIVSRSGGQDRLVIIYNADRFDVLDTDELEYINIGGTVRAPLLIYVYDKQSGQDMVFMVNHLNRGTPQRRHDQAVLLNEWAITDNRAAIAVGDYNFDWEVVGGDEQHDLGYDYMTAQQEWVWVRPVELTTTQCSGWPCGFDSVLDFVFSANGAQGWSASAQIVVVDGDFPDNSQTTDHRPVLAWFQVPISSTTNLTPTPQVTPTITPTATLTPGGATANRNANLRAGPGTTYAIVGQVTVGQHLVLTGRNQETTWLQVQSTSWIAAFLVDNAPTDLPVVSLDEETPSAPTTQPTPTSLPPVTATPQPSPTIATTPTLRIVSVNKQAEYVDIENGGLQLVELGGWVLRSERGSQDCPLSGVLTAGQSLRIWAMRGENGFNCGFGAPIWNNSQPDPAVLLDPSGAEVSRLE